VKVSDSITTSLNAVIAEHKNTFKAAHEGKHRAWFKKEYPHLQKTRNTDRVLYDMNVNSVWAPLSTGICLPVALFVKSYIKDAHGVDVELVGLFDEYAPGYFSFCHCVLKHDNVYYDTFWPEGKEDLKQFLYADICKVQSVERIVNCFKTHEGCEYIKTNLFDKVKDTLYSKDCSTENYFKNMHPVT